MKEPNDFPPIKYSTKVKLIINKPINNKENTKKYMNDIITSTFLKNYFFVMPLSKR
tara:strand:+ start:143 stop:310 length:168 start_codon:yes stop_codon:yes gene_type:complete